MSFDVLTGTVGAFGMFVPMNLVQARHADPDDQRKVSDLRMGLFLAGLWSFVIAAHYANQQKNAQPYIYWLGGVAIMVTLYEAALRSRYDVDLRDGENR